MTPILSVCLSATFRSIFCLPLLILFFLIFPLSFPIFLCSRLLWKNPLLVRQTRLGSRISRSVHFAPKTFHCYFIFPPPEFHYFSWQHRIRYDEPCKAKYPMRIGAARKAIRDRKRLLSELSVMLMVIRLLFSHFLFFIFYFFPFFPSHLARFISITQYGTVPFSLSNGWRTRRQMRGESKE